MNFGETDVLRRRTDLRNVDVDRFRRDRVGKVERETSLGVVRELSERHSGAVGEGDVSSEHLICKIRSVPENDLVEALSGRPVEL